MKDSFQLDGISVIVYSTPAPQILFLQPVDEHDARLLDSEKRTAKAFLWLARPIL